MTHPDQIVDAVCSVFHVTRDDLMGDSRERIVSEPRKIAAYLIHTRSLLTYKQIATMFNRKDHTTVMYYVKTIKIDLLERAWIAQLVAEVEQTLGPIAAEPEPTTEPTPAP